MAGETLRTAAQLLSEFPDNAAGLIDAIASRNFITSAGMDVAFIEEEFGIPGTPLPLTGVVADTVVSDVWSTPTEAFRFWERTGGQVRNDYSDVGVIVPAGVNRITQIRYEILATRQKPVSPLTFGGTYQVQHGDAGPAAGDVDFHSNLQQAQIADLDEDGIDLSTSWESLGERDYFNVQGILHKLNGPAIPGAGFTTLTWDDPLTRPAEEAGNDPHSFLQGLARDDDFYEFGIFQNGNQISSNPRAVADLGSAIQVSESILQEYALQDVFDLRVGRLEAGSPDINISILNLTTFGVLI